MPKVGQQWPNAFVMDLPTLNGSSIEDFVMATFSVSLPDRMKEYIDAQVKGRDFVDSGDFLREFPPARSGAADRGTQADSRGRNRQRHQHDDDERRTCLDRACAGMNTAAM